MKIVTVIGFITVLPSIFTVKASGEPSLQTVLWNAYDSTHPGRDKEEFSLIEGLSDAENGVAWANYTNMINETGWSFLEIKTEPAFPDRVQAYAAGFVEGASTSELLYMHWYNTVKGYCDGKEKVCQKINVFLSKNLKFIQRMTTPERRKRSPYWHHVALFYDQLHGLVDGYNRKSTFKISFADFYWMNVFGDLEDLEQAFSEGETSGFGGRVLGSGSCSALIKILPGNRDIYAAHDTWNTYQSMLRIIKRYDLGFRWKETNQRAFFGPDVIPGYSMSFSGYPGVIYSGDDFNVIGSSGLTVIETTIGNNNASLWKYVKPEGQVLEGVRATVANRLAKNGRDWTAIFAKRNSGTYNNQWMVLDYKLFKNGSAKLKDGLLWVLEQLPGYIRSADVTDILRRQGYWPSYNSPFFNDIFKLSGNEELVKKYGNWFSYDKTPRALIFKRDQRKVKDVESMVKLMRYNDFTRDPLSKCDCKPPYSAENAISARNDLNPKNGTYPFGALGHRSHGGTDMKMTSSELFAKQSFIAISGPTFDSVPPFQWSLADFASDTPHMGHPDKWQFYPVAHTWSNFFN